MKTRAAVQFRVKEPLSIEEIELPAIGPDQVQLRLTAAGLCLSQIHELRGVSFERPRGFGHEASGVVETVGRDVKHVKEGDHALLTWVPRTPIVGRKKTEVTGATVGGKTLHGAYWGWGDRVVVRDEFVIPIRKDDPLDLASVVGCGVMTGAGAVKNTAGVKAGNSVAIFGVGGVGSSALLMAVALGASPIIAVDLKPEKLAYALEMGATHVINASVDDAVQAIWDITGEGADYAFDTVGVRQAAESIIPSVRGGGPGVSNVGGMAVLVGNPEPEITIQPAWFVGHQRRLAGSHGAVDPRTELQNFLDLHREGRFPLDKLVTTRYTLAQVNDAVDALTRGEILGRAIFEL